MNGEDKWRSFELEFMYQFSYSFKAPSYLILLYYLGFRAIITILLQF